MSLIKINQKMLDDQNRHSRIEEIHSELSDLDLLSLRATRAILSGTGTDEDHTVIECIEAEAILLREELETLKGKIQDGN